MGVKADFVVRRARIRTLWAECPFAEALAAWRGRILAIGRDEEIRDLIGPGTRVLDAGGATVLPGFHDAHCHILLFGLSLVEVNAREARTIADIVETVAAHARRTPPGRWIRGGGYNENKLRERRHPTRYDLDPVSPEHPVWLLHVSGHMGVANSRALALAGITRETPDPPGGRIVRDAAGEPTGLLLETAQELIKRVLPLTPWRKPGRRWRRRAGGWRPRASPRPRTPGRGGSHRRSSGPIRRRWRRGCCPSGSG